MGKKHKAIKPAAQHLAAALAAQNSLKQGTGNESAAFLRRTSLSAQSTGEALAFLLHPGSSDLPSPLRDEAWALLSSGIQALSGISLSAPSGGSLDSTGSNALAGKPSSAPGPAAANPAWQQRAKKTPSFQKLLDLAGLEPVKEALSDLADQVSESARKESVCACGASVRALPRWHPLHPSCSSRQPAPIMALTSDGLLLLRLSWMSSARGTCRRSSTTSYFMATPELVG